MYNIEGALPVRPRRRAFPPTSTAAFLAVSVGQSDYVTDLQALDLRGSETEFC